MIKINQTPFEPFSLTHFSRPQIPQIEELGGTPTITTTECKQPKFRVPTINFKSMKIEVI